MAGTNSKKVTVSAMKLRDEALLKCLESLQREATSAGAAFGAGKTRHTLDDKKHK